MLNLDEQQVLTELLILFDCENVKVRMLMSWSRMVDDRLNQEHRIGLESIFHQRSICLYGKKMYVKVINCSIICIGEKEKILFFRDQNIPSLAISPKATFLTRSPLLKNFQIPALCNSLSTCKISSFDIHWVLQGTQALNNKHLPLLYT